MKKDCRFNLLGILFILLATICTSCDKNNNDESEPIDTVTLNMLNEENGKTLLGSSDVFINKSNNFKMSSSYIFDAGEVSGVGAWINPVLTNLSQEAAVVPGHAYQVFNKPALFKFPSGTLAIKKGTAFYQVYVVSQIKSNNITTGSMVKFFAKYPDGKNLPAYNNIVGDFNYKGDTLKMKFPTGAEYVIQERDYSDVSKIFTTTVVKDELIIILNENPNQEVGPYGPYTIHMRLENVYTSVIVNVKALQ